MASVIANPYEELPFSDQKRWIIIYPAFLNSRKTIAEGRRIAKTKAVDNPLASEIKDICQSQQLQAELEGNKLYPRELNKDHIHIGRVRVQLKNDDGSHLNPNISSRKELYNVLCELIPKLKTRQSGASRAGGSEPQGSSAGSGGGSSGAGGGTSKKKKGRRK